MNWQVIWDFLDKSGILIGIVTFVFSIMIWIKVKTQTRKLKQMAVNVTRFDDYQELKDFQSKVQTERPKAFCLSLVPQQASIKDNVKRFLDGKKMQMDIVEMNMDGLKPDTIQSFIEKLRLKRRTELNDATEIHLFLQGPVQAGILIGAMFDNWIPVKLYQFERQTGNYEYWGPLVK
jgi:hypothetical protein